MPTPTRVVNIRHEKCDVYIGRNRTPHHYGNPFGRLRHDGGHTCSAVLGLHILHTYDREDTIKAYRDWLNGTAHQSIDPQRRQWILDNLIRLKGMKLGCFCKPLTCHGDVLVELLETHHGHHT